MPKPPPKTETLSEKDALALVQALVATPRLRKILRVAVLNDKLVEV